MARTVTILLLLLLLVPGRSLAALPADAASAVNRGRQALTDRLPELAARRFGEALASEGLGDPERRDLLLLLAEAQVRSDQATAALQTLGNPLLKESKLAVFWRGQTLAGLGRFAEAVTTLEAAAADPSHPFHTETCFTRASLLLSLGDPAAARATLEPLLGSGDPDIARLARLRLAEIAFDLGQFPAAREALSTITKPQQAIKGSVDYLDARLLVEEGKPQLARDKFAALAATTETLSREMNQRVQLGLANALSAAGDPATASDTLIAFITNNPQSTLLGTAFEQLLDLLPADATANDPILKQVEKWLPAAALPAGRPVPLHNGGALAAWPSATDSDQPELGALALYHLARGLHSIGDVSARNRALALMRRLPLEYPEHPLGRQALLEIGHWHLENKKLTRAQAALGALAAIAIDPRLKAQASFLLGSSSLDAGDPAAAAKAFAAAAAAMAGEAAENAAINVGVARLRSGDLAAFDTADNPSSARVAAELALERGLILASRRDPAARNALDRFIIDHPQHPRLPEARLALAGAAMTGESPDLKLAAAQLATLAAAPDPALAAANLAAARIRLAELRGQWDKAAAEAAAFLAAHPDDPAAPGLALRLGQALFRKGDYNDARLTLERLAEAQPTSPIAEAALFLAARAAALSATPQARNESLALYQRVARTNGSLADSARLERARTLIDMSRFDDAIKELREWLRSLDPESRLGFSSGALLGEALYAKGGNDTAAYEEALTLYRDLVARSAPESALNHRFRYLLGLTLERLDRPGEALDTYYSLLESAALHPPLEWEWAERAGFRALALLENAQRWPAALRISERIAALGGPRAPEAADRARTLRLEHMIWED